MQNLIAIIYMHFDCLSNSPCLKLLLTFLRVEDADVGQLFTGMEQLGKEVTRITLKFKVEGQDEGIYSAVISTYEDGDMFCLDAVYRDTDTKNKARLNFALPGL